MKTRLIIFTIPMLAVSALAQENPPAAEPPETEQPPAAPVPNLPEQDPTVETEDGTLIIQARGLRSKPAPVFFSARVHSTINVSDERWTFDGTIAFEVLQGKAKVFALGLHGDGEITSILGEGIRDWAVRQTPQGRMLEIRPAENAPKIINATVKGRLDRLELPANTAVLTLGPGESVGFSNYLTLNAANSVDVRITEAAGLVPVKSPDKDADRVWKFQAWGPSKLALQVAKSGAALAPVEFVDVKLEGTSDPERRTVSFVLTGEARVTREGGGKARILSGHAAASSLPQSEDFRMRLVVSGEGAPYYELEFPKTGAFPIRIEFQAGLIGNGSGSKLDFNVPAGAAVPVSIAGLKEDVKFDANCPVFPTASGRDWLGFLPANGHCLIAWQSATETGDGKLFFASDATIETIVGAGLLRQKSYIDLKVLQGKLEGVTLLLEGPGEILAVQGSNVLGWSFEGGDNGARKIAIRLGRPAEGTESITVISQTPLNEFPLREQQPLRLTPEGGVRHSGYVRVVSEGAVRLEVSSVTGMTQLAPEQFKAREAVPEGARQFVYRFPSAKHDYAINASQILPEVGIKQIVLYEMAESDRVIRGEIELDIREAPLREWEFSMPENYGVLSVTGTEVVDNVVGEPADGRRTVRVLFRQAVIGRQLVAFRLSETVDAAAGAWPLPPITYPNAKTVRGHIGVSAIAGYRVTAGENANLSEIPLAYFPKRNEAGLQQTFRLREAAWSATMNVEQLPQSVQADVFHLYSLKEGIAYGSVLVNYFVVGAPVNQWRLEVPASIGNVAIDGQNVLNWKREENEVQVILKQPALGPATLLLTFEQPMSARGGTLNPGEVKPLDVQGERGFIQVVSPSQVKHNVVQASDSLLPIEPLELPAEFRLFTSSPSLVVYQYAAREFDLQLNFEWFEHGETIDQVVDYATLESEVSRDGQVVTTAVFEVKTRGRKSLRMRIPEGMHFWGARVGTEAVNARSDGDFTLIPLPANLDPNTPVQVLVRLDQTAKNPKRPRLTAPALSAPTMIATWKVRGDTGKLLVPDGSQTAQPAKRTLTETGFEWLQKYGASPHQHREIRGMLVALAILLLLGLLASRWSRLGGVTLLLGTLLLVGALVISIILVDKSGEHRRVNIAALEFVAPVVTPDEPVTIALKNIPTWKAMVSPFGILLGAAGVVALGFGLFRKVGLAAFAGCILISIGLLMQRGGAPCFFVWLAVFLVLAVLWPLLRELWTDSRAFVASVKKKRAEKRAMKFPDPDSDEDGDTPEDGGSAKGAATSLLIAGAIGASLLIAPTSAPAQDNLTADAAKQSLRIEKGRLFGEIAFEASGKTNNTFLLLHEPAILTQFEGEGVRVTKRALDGRTSYWIVLERDGSVTAKASYELALPKGAQSFTLPSARAAVQQVDVVLDQPGWEFASPVAVKTETLANVPANRSGARLILGPGTQPQINLIPRSRDVASEEAQFFAEVANLYVPGPGLVDGRHKVTVRPSRGQIRKMQFTVPAGFTVSEVTAPNLGSWRFDPENQSLAAEFNPPHSAPFSLVVETQMGTNALPSDVNLATLTVTGAASEVGMLAIAFGPDAQSGSVKAEGGLSKVSLEDFDASIAAGMNPAPVIHQVWRYSGKAGSVKAEITGVEPEVRVFTSQTLSIGSERIVLGVGVLADITRAGLFRLSFAIPDGLEIEGASGGALSHWTESTQENARVITLHLKARTTGTQQFNLSFAGPAPGAQTEWTVPRFSIREATRQNGRIIIAPERGIRLETVSRNQVNPFDVSKLQPEKVDKMIANLIRQPGTLGFDLLRADWSLVLGLEELEPWITAQALQEVTLREGLTKTRLSLAYRVENAAVKALRVTLPGLGPEEAATVRASGDAVSDIVAVEGEQDVWEIRFQRRIYGNANVAIEFQRTTSRAGGVESISMAGIADARQLSMWLAVRASGRLEIQVASAGTGWQPVDWTGIPRTLHNARDRSVPALAFRAVAPENPLSVRVQRHAVADALSLRVSSGDFITVFSTEGSSVTEARMNVAVVEKSTMRVRLPEGATLFNTFVNGESVGIVREADDYLFHVQPPEDGAHARVSLAWTVPAVDKKRKRFHLTGPSLNVPLQNITWQVALPEGYELSGSDGSLELENVEEMAHFNLAQYRQAQQQERAQEASDANRLLERANLWINEGDQRKARKALSRASKNVALDKAANEDARVQLRELQTEQAVIGLNTRRQKLYFDNIGNDIAQIDRNRSLEEAANINPLFKGELNYDPKAVETLLRGNTVEENSALKRIASRIVSQQLAAEPAVKAIDITLPPNGKLHVFKRSVQVDGGAPLELKLDVRREREVKGWFLLATLAGLAILMGLGLRRNRAVSATG